MCRSTNGNFGAGVIIFWQPRCFEWKPGSIRANMTVGRGQTARLIELPELRFNESKQREARSSNYKHTALISIPHLLDNNCMPFIVISLHL